MRKGQKYYKLILMLSVGMCLVCFAADLATARYGNADSMPWLANFAGGPVRITFAVCPPESERSIKATLVEVESAGLVLRIPKEKEKFFPFTNIICVEPI